MKSNHNKNLTHFLKANTQISGETLRLQHSALGLFIHQFARETSVFMPCLYTQVFLLKLKVNGFAK